MGFDFPAVAFLRNGPGKITAVQKELDKVPLRTYLAPVMRPMHFMQKRRVNKPLIKQTLSARQ